jgi:hypothetical protein
MQITALARFESCHHQCFKTRQLHGITQTCNGLELFVEEQVLTVMMFLRLDHDDEGDEDSEEALLCHACCLFDCLFD